MMTSGRMHSIIIRMDRRLLELYGRQGWWPITPEAGGRPVYRQGKEGAAVDDRGAFEIVVGAVLTQNTAWRNVETALSNLTGQFALDPAVIARCGPELESAVRPSGYFNQKARRLREISKNIIDHGGIEALRECSTANLRHLLLSWKGIGPETADSILCYAFARPVFVVDAYTKRLFSGLNLPHASYAGMQDLVHQSLPPDAALYNDLHARIVKLFAMKAAAGFVEKFNAEDCVD